MSFATIITKAIFSVIDIVRFFKFKLFDKEESEILDIVESTLISLFG